MNTKDYFIQLTQEELPATLNCFRAIPSESDSYAPNPKNRTARRIVSHIIGHPLDLIEGLETGALNHRNETEFADYNAAANQYESDTKRLVEMLKNIDEATWDEKPVDFNLYGMKLYTKSLRDVCYQMHSDTIHHRGQLSTYYRQMGVPNPVIYGATAETVEKMMAAQTA